jgi:DNA-binding transcriptional MerR regulator
LVERTHLSIGEVLSLLREEFPDVTISKIRFLESQGLLDPERTPSGYRKFYDDDIERLRWILRQQREHFLPLKVIKGRLSEQGGNGPTSGGDSSAATVTAVPSAPSHSPSPSPSPSPERARPEPAPSSERARPEPSPQASPAARRESAIESSPVSPSPSPTPSARPSPVPPAVRQPGPTQEREPTPQPGPTTPVAKTGPARPPTSAPGPAAAARQSEPDSWAYTPGGTGLTADELASATGLAEHQVIELARYGMLTSRDVGGTTYFDDEALTVARLAAGFARHGVEARHLRMYKNSADRESGLFEQIVMPLIKQRNPRAREEATETLVELSRLGGELREALLRHALGDAF